MSVYVGVMNWLAMQCVSLPMFQAQETNGLKKKKDGYNDLKCKNRNKYLELTSM